MSRCGGGGGGCLVSLMVPLLVFCSRKALASTPFMASRTTRSFWNVEISVHCSADHPPVTGKKQSLCTHVACGVCRLKSPPCHLLSAGCRTTCQQHKQQQQVLPASSTPAGHSCSHAQHRWVDCLHCSCVLSCLAVTNPLKRVQPSLAQAVRLDYPALFSV